MRDRSNPRAYPCDVQVEAPRGRQAGDQGSTIGVTIVRKPSQWKEALRLAHQYDEEAMVEAFISGHEVTVSLLGGAEGAVNGLPAVEIVAPDGFYDFSAKYRKAGRSISARRRCLPR